MTLAASEQTDKLKPDHQRKLSEELLPCGIGQSEVRNQLIGEPKGSSQNERINTKNPRPIRTDRLQDNPGIGKQIGLASVFLVELQLSRKALLHRGGTLQQRFFVVEPQRSEIGDARFVFQDSPLFASVMLDISRHLRARTDQAHLSAQHVPKLRQFIQLCPPQQPADRSDAQITIAGNSRPARIGSGNHRAEFPDEKWNPLLPDSSLAIKDRAPVGKLDCQCYEKEKRAEQNQSQGGEEKIVKPLRCQTGCGPTRKRAKR